MQRTKSTGYKSKKAFHHSFKDEKLLLQALTHSSYANSMGLKSNETLEYLGDAVLELIISFYLYTEYPDLNEGELTRRRAMIVSEPSLSSAARELDLGSFLILGKGEEMTGGRGKPSILADAFEALTGAIYLDGGMKSARKFIFKTLINNLGNMDASSENRDFKTLLQHELHKNFACDAHYQTQASSGPAHNRTFISRVYRGNVLLGEGEGKNKKEAEQRAARQAIEHEE